MVTITVSDPRMEQPDTRYSFISYLVSTKQGNSVRHRYSDFRWLYERLQTEIPGAIVPIIPHTRTVMSSKKFNPEFIEERRRDLQEFLLSIADHPELCRAPAMTPFMLLEFGTDFDDGKKKLEQNSPTISSEVIKGSEEGRQSDSSNSSSRSQPLSSVKARKGITSFFAKMRLSAGAQELMTTQDENEVRALQDYVAEINMHAKILTKASDALLKSTLNTADAYHEIGVPIGLWSTTNTEQNENQDEDVKEMMTGICKFSDEMSSLLQKKHEEEEFLFVHKIHKLANTISAFEIALNQRKKFQVDFTHTHNIMFEKHAALEKAQKNLKPPEVTDKLNNERAELESKIERKKKRFDEVTKRILRDAEKYKPQLVLMLKEAFLMLTKFQISYTTRINEACQRLMPSLEKAALPSAPPPPPPPGSEEGGTSEELQ